MIRSRCRAFSLAAAMTMLLAACAGTAPTATPPARVLIGPTSNGYSDAAVYGSLVWTAGHLPLQADSHDPIEVQTEAVLDNLQATLERAGAGFDTVVKTNVYLLSFDDWEAFNEVYVRRVGATGLPPRTTVQVAGLGLGRIEIEMVAYVRTP